MRALRRSVAAASVILAAACGAPAAPPAAPAPAAPTAQAPPAVPAPIELPIEVEGARFFLETKTADGAPIRLYLDSAGGMNLTRTAIERLKLPVQRKVTIRGSYETVALPKLADPRVPLPDPPDLHVMDRGMAESDGMLGAPWFAQLGPVTFDYERGKLLLRAKGDLPATPAAHRIPLAMPRDSEGRILSPYGRMQMEVDGAVIDMLFDTGATVVFTDAGLQAFGGATRERATSFITQSVFDRWRKAHPDWRVADDMDRSVKGSPMIEVPVVRIAGHDVGPVWFTRRPDKAFHEYMAQMMDKQTEGALGGSAFVYFKRVTADWHTGQLVFEK